LARISIQAQLPSLKTTLRLPETSFPPSPSGANYIPARTVREQAKQVRSQDSELKESDALRDIEKLLVSKKTHYSLLSSSNPSDEKANERLTRRRCVGPPDNGDFGVRDTRDKATR